jgi:hypothetical protein
MYRQESVSYCVYARHHTPAESDAVLPQPPVDRVVASARTFTVRVETPGPAAAAEAGTDTGAEAGAGEGALPELVRQREPQLMLYPVQELGLKLEP